MSVEPNQDALVKELRRLAEWVEPEHDIVSAEVLIEAADLIESLSTDLAIANSRIDVGLRAEGEANKRIAKLEGAIKQSI